MDAAQLDDDRTLVGIDEVGIGCLAGPVVAAAVILDPANPINGITDSKKISEQKRKILADQIMANAVDWAIGQASVSEIDQHNILRASHLAMQRAYDDLKSDATLVLVDGNKSPYFPVESKAVIKGDETVLAIGAASIIAKVFRDGLMDELGRKYPAYDFEKNKGYPTKSHMQTLRAIGPCAQHRSSFAPVKNWNIRSH
tara:strand:- start:264 stop:860 length:597 start_codon:yes stop_codon:yes gene_type:complete